MTEETDTSYSTIINMLNEATKQLREVHELVEEYRISGDHTMARAHITLYKIDEIITGFDSSQPKVINE